jgi:hypothetical protein
VKGAEQPRDGPSMNLPQKAGSDNNAKLCDQDDQLEGLEAPTATSNPSPEEVETTIGEEPPGPPDTSPETTPELVAMELSTNSPVPAPDPGEVGTWKNLRTSKWPRDAFGTVEVRRR